MIIHFAWTKALGEKLPGFQLIAREEFKRVNWLQKV
jgi:hypothetical protein